MPDRNIIYENALRVRAEIDDAARKAGRRPEEILLCAASKMHSAQDVIMAREAPIDVFGESRVQELLQKQEADAFGAKPLHFIGHLQTNKVKQLIGHVSVIETVDSLRLLQKIGEEADKAGVRQKILLEVNIGREESKSGLLPEELFPLVEAALERGGVELCGLMAIPPASTEEKTLRKNFSAMYRLFLETKEKFYPGLSWLSMGMSGDYRYAILEGANIVRIGTAIFGARDYGGKQKG